MTFEEKISPVQVMGPVGGPGIYRFSLSTGEVRHGMNPPLEESDLRKVSPEEMKKRFGTLEIKVVEYKEGMISGVHGRKKELWPFFLVFLLIVLAVEMVIANGIPRTGLRDAETSSA